MKRYSYEELVTKFSERDLKDLLSETEQKIGQMVATDNLHELVQMKKDIESVLDKKNGQTE